MVNIAGSDGGSDRSFLQQHLRRIQANPIFTRLASGVFWSLVGLVISKGLMLAGNIFVARLLEKPEYGELGVIQSTITMFGAFAGFGLGLTATKYVAQCRTDDPARAGNIIGLTLMFGLINGTMLGAALLFFAPWLAETVLSSTSIAPSLRVGALVLLLSAINGVLIGTLSGFEAFKGIAKVNSIVGLLSFPAFVLGAYYGGVTGCVWGIALGLAIHVLLNVVWLFLELRKWNIKLHFTKCFSEMGILWRFSLPAALGGILVGPVNWATAALIVNTEGGYGEMAIFNAANQWFNLLLFVPNIVGSVVLPMLAQKFGKGSEQDSKKTLALTVKVNLALVVPMLLMGAVFSKHIMGFYGEEYVEGWSTLIVILVTVCLLVINSPVGQMFAASERMWIGFWMNAGWAAAYVSATLMFAELGALGLASARCIAYLFHTLWQYYFVKRTLFRC